MVTNVDLKKKGNSVRKRKDREEIKKKSRKVQLHINLSSTVLVIIVHRILIKGTIKRVPNILKPVLTHDNNKTRLEFALCVLQEPDLCVQEMSN